MMPELSHELAYLFHLEKREEDADQDLRQNPFDVEAYTDRAWANLQQGNFTKAVDDFTAAIRLSESDPWTYLHRGEAHFRSGEFQKTIQDVNAAIALKTNFIEAYLLRSDARRRLGDESGASADETEVHRLLSAHS